MLRPALNLRIVSIVVGVALAAFSGWAAADPPSRIARLAYVSGGISLSPSGENDWAQATLNRPLTTGDRLWADARGRAEVQLGGAIVRMNAGTSLAVLNLDDQTTQLQLTQGTLVVRVRRLERDQVFEVDTPNLAMVVRQPGEYRIAVDLDGNATTIVVRQGQAEVYGDTASYVIDPRQPYRFSGTDLREYQYVDAPRPDEFDRWASDRDRAWDNSVSARYVSRDVIGYQDLDANGRWRVDATYGNVWIPNRVSAGWAPYRDGHWAWVDPWGWTWVDDAPWGFAVSHYGRWANLGGTWGWVPGPVSVRAYYAPALVVFVGGDNFQLAFSSGSAGAVAWFPLAPREVYRPSYAVSRGYFENINRSNTVVSNTVINNYYNNVNVTNVVYVNRAVAGAVVAVPTTTFVQAQPVSRAALKVAPATLAQRPVVAAPPVAPTERSVRGIAPQADKPPQRVFERPVLARAAPPAAHAGFSAQQPQLAAKPGLPLDEAVRKQLKPAESAPVPAVKVIAQPHKAPPTVRPPPVAAAARPDAANEKPVEPGPAAAAPMVTRPAAPAQGVTSVPPKAAEPAAPAVAPRRATEPRGSTEARPPAAKESKVAAPQPEPLPSAAPMPQPGGPPQQRGRADQPGQSAAPAQRAAEPKVAPAQADAPAPPTQRGAVEPRGPSESRRPVAAEPPSSRPPPATPVPQSGGSPQPRGRDEPRGQAAAPTQRAAEPKVVPPEAVPPAPAAVPQAAQRPTRPIAPRVPDAVPAAPLASQPGERRRPPATPPTAVRAPEATPTPPPPQRDAAPSAQRRVQGPKPAASEPADKKDKGDERKRGQPG